MVHPATHILLGLHLYMEAQLALHFIFPLFDLEQRAQAAPQSARHNSAPSISPANLPVKSARSPPTTASSSRSLHRVVCARHESACNTLPGGCFRKFPTPTKSSPVLQDGRARDKASPD